MADLKDLVAELAEADRLCNEWLLANPKYKGQAAEYRALHERYWNAMKALIAAGNQEMGRHGR